VFTKFKFEVKFDVKFKIWMMNMIENEKLSLDVIFNISNQIDD
jgi:hypothetical protein